MSSVSTRSSRWWPSAIFVHPSSTAALYRIPLRSREHPRRDPARLEVPLHHMGRIARLTLIQVDGQEVEADRRPLPHPHQDVEQGVAVLPARDRHPQALALLDEL